MDRPSILNLNGFADHMNDLAARYKSLLDAEFQQNGLVRENPAVRFWSSVTGERIHDAQGLGPGYFKANLTSRVRFNTAVQRILQHQSNNVFLEIGPHSTLAGPLRQICSITGSDYRYIPTMLRGKDCESSALAALGQLYQNGVSFDFKVLYPTGRALSNLPTYAWKHDSSYWYESRVSKEWRLRKVGYHGLLGVRIPESTSFEPIWRNMLSLEDEPWIADHKIVNDVVFPFAGYISMAGEAVRQATGVEGGYRIRQAIAKAALVLQDSTPVEMVTALRPIKMSDSADFTWFEFTISSFSGSNWILHCHGQVRAFTEMLPLQGPEEAELPRRVPSHRWYQTMADIGIVYGPQFQGLSEIASSTTANLATAKITVPSYERPAFLFHPASVDACLQLLLVAMAKGIGRNFGDLCIPTTIEDLSISRSIQNMEAIAWSNGTTDAAVDCFANGRPVLQLRGLQLTPVNNSRETSTLEPHAAARLQWDADFDLADHSKLFKPPPCVKEETWMQEEMTLLCMLETAERVRGLKACQPHFEKFREWLEMEIKRAIDGTYPLLGKKAQDFVFMSPTARAKLITDLYGQLRGLSAKGSVATGIMRIYENCERIFTGEGDTLDILMQDDMLTRIYDAVSFGKGQFFRLLCHSRPMLRVLEVGAGTGGTTEMILRELIRPDELPCYSQYTFTDISAGFFPQAKERFSYAPNMEYRVFDISQSPFQQGFESETYDVILAPNVVHATPSLNETLNNLQPLLRPGGLLVLTELCAVVRTPNYIFGNFSGWWLGEADARPYEPYVSVERWDDELKKAGFSGVDTAICDAEAPYHYCAAIVSSRPRMIDSRPVASRPLTILCEHPEKGIGKRLIDDLTRAGVTVQVCLLGETPATDQDIISLLDLEGYFFETVTADRLVNFQKILNSNMNQFQILWLLRPTQIRCQDPRSGQAIGVARSIRAESSVPFYTLEISENEGNFSNLVLRVWEKIVHAEDSELLSPDKEYVVDDGVVKVGRYQQFLVEKSLSRARLVGNTASSVSLEISTAGQLDSLKWIEMPFNPKLGAGEVLIDTRAVGLNFKARPMKPKTPNTCILRA